MTAWMYDIFENFSFPLQFLLNYLSVLFLVRQPSEQAALVERLPDSASAYTLKIHFII